MNAHLPKYMSIQDFCKYSGFSRYQFIRMVTKANIKLKVLGTFRMVNVQEALAAIEALPDADREVPVNLNPNGAIPAGENEAREMLDETTERMEAGE